MWSPRKPHCGPRVFTSEIYDTRTGEVLSRHLSSHNAGCQMRRHERRWDPEAQAWVENPHYPYLRVRAFIGGK
jgi:hypothetical protein